MFNLFDKILQHNRQTEGEANGQTDIARQHSCAIDQSLSQSVSQFIRIAADNAGMTFFC